ncbi:MAG: Holliday junction branch migration protein RuvA [Thermoanaerobacterales bacterium]|nr:Holliday junction branch migration protein RuvA [Thermoanaerobacterales bacterium]
MFDYIKGLLVDLQPDRAVLETYGIGYTVSTSFKTYSRIKDQVNREIKLYVYLIIKEDSVELAGFYDRVERQAFLLLNRVPGIGSKAAFSILSMLDVASLKHCIMTDDIKTLITIPGIGKKTAQKIIIDLKDKVEQLPIEMPDTTSSLDMIVEAKEVLISLGFSSHEVMQALKGLNLQEPSVENLVREALKKL